ncbi:MULTISPECIES: LysR family transcriptional regulator [Streptomyces]|uniref:LysR family transcriptional regulator n=1 Tax=Streptomyces ramulosus TaxID=47762 RepID=A0ABW1FKN6_9ACTN
MTRNGAARDANVRHLRAFLVLAEELHFGRAAARLFITQPALSQRIRALERDLGVRLLDRSTRRVGLTCSGAELLPAVEEAVRAADRLREQAGARSGAGGLVIASFENIALMEPVPAVMDAFRAAAPGVGVAFRRAAFDTATVLLEGDADAAFLFLPVPDGIQYLTLAEGARCAALSAADPLARREVISLADLRDRPHLGWSPRVPKVYRQHWSTDPRPDGSPVRYTGHDVVDYSGSLLAIAMGEGIQLPPEAARHRYPRPGVAYVDVKDLPPWSMGLAWLPGKRDLPHVRALRAAAHRVTGERERG